MSRVPVARRTLSTTRSGTCGLRPGAGARMMAVMSRHPEETTEQWCTRATFEYRGAWEAFGIEWRRMAQTGYFRPWGYPLLDEGYDGAMDALDDADNERGEAAIALDRELHPIVRDRTEWRRRRRGFQSGYGSP